MTKQINIDLTAEERARIDSALAEEENKGFKKNFIYKLCLLTGSVSMNDVIERKPGEIKPVAVLLEENEREQLEKEYAPYSEAIEKGVFFAVKIMSGLKKRSIKNV
jgi:hypothetical protein